MLVPLVLVPDGYAEIGLEFLRTGATRPGVITFGVKLKAAPTIAQLATDVRSAWTVGGSLNGAQPSTVVCKFIRAKWKWGGVAGSGQTTTTWTAGGGSPALAPPAVALVVKKATGFAGRAMRGRMMLPWASESDVDNNGNVLTATVNAYNTALGLFRTVLNANARVQIDELVLLHSSATTPTLVTALTLRNKAGTVRDRQVV